MRDGAVAGRRPGVGSALALGVLAVAGCELQEVTTTVPANLVVAEAVLWAGESAQTVFLHRSFGGPADSVPDARVSVYGDDGSTLTFAPAEVRGVCTVPGERGGTCYVSDPTSSYVVVPGERYRLDIRLADGGRLHAVTTVPGAFDLRTPPRRDAAGRCRLPAGTQLELAWTRSPGAWVYLVEADFGASLADALPALEVPVPFRTVGLSVGSADTALVFPREMGTFDRLDEEATEVLVALQAGMPPGTDARIVVAAADRNYVNWVRGGAFNPSGIVRIASVEGDGTGVFGALNVKSFHAFTEGAELPACAR